MEEITLNGLYVYGAFGDGGSVYISEIKAGGDEVIVNKIAPEYLDLSSREPLIVNFTKEGYSIVASATYQEIYNALIAGRRVIGRATFEDVTIETMDVRFGMKDEGNL